MRGPSLQKVDTEPWSFVPGNIRENLSLFAHLLERHTLEPQS